MLIMSELLSLADLDFVRDCKNTFIALNTSLTGELTRKELQAALGEKYSDELYGAVDHDDGDSISFSEWLCALAYATQLTAKNLSNIFQFLDLKKQGKIKASDLELAYRPHMFRLRRRRGTELDNLQKLLAEVDIDVA